MEQRFAFAFDPVAAALLRLGGIRPETTEVVVDATHLRVRFGRLRCSTPVSNVTDAHVAGPYRAHRVIGPRFSLADHGVTFGTTTAAGACICVAEPVAALFGRRAVHPNITVTVADPQGLVDAIDRARDAT